MSLRAFWRESSTATWAGSVASFKAALVAALALIRAARMEGRMPCLISGFTKTAPAICKPPA